MRFVINVVLLLLAGCGLAVGAMFLASELGGEVVGLRSFDAEGRGYDTRLWIVDHENRGYLRGSPDSGWYARIEAAPQVELDRAGQTQSFQAIPSESMSERVNQLMAQKYGVANQMLGLAADVDENTAIRLEPIRD